MATATLDEEALEVVQLPLACFPLEFAEGREAFLRNFCDVGETRIFEAVSHIWSSLAEPQDARCTAMGMAAGTGGRGKSALVKLLRACLEEVLFDANPLPPRSAYNSLHEWHEAAMACFAADKAKNTAVYKRYSTILDGGNCQ